MDIKIQNEIANKFKAYESEAYTEAQKKYPSRQFFDKNGVLDKNNEEKWFSLVEKQREYQCQKSRLFSEQLQKEYNLTKDELDNIIHSSNMSKKERIKESFEIYLLKIIFFISMGIILFLLLYFYNKLI